DVCAADLRGDARPDGARGGRPQERRIEGGRLGRHRAERHLDACFAQHVEAAPGLRIGVADRRDDALHSRGEDRVRAGRRLAVMGARLECYDERAPAGALARGPERHDLGAGAVVPAAVTSSRPSRAATAMIPMQRLNTRGISRSETLPPRISTRNTAGQRHEPASTIASHPSGSTRTRLPGIPPPVIWASAWTW